jgi:hypothetical protein
MWAGPLRGVVSRGGEPMPLTLGGPKAKRAETWGYFCMKNVISTTLNCHSHIHESTHFISFALLKLHPPCFPRLAFTSKIQMHDRLQSWFGTDISIKRGGVKLILLETTSPFTKMMRFTCEQVHWEGLEVWTLSLSIIFYWMVGSWCLTPLSIIFQLYRGDYFYSIRFCKYL